MATRILAAVLLMAGIASDGLAPSAEYSLALFAGTETTSATFSTAASFATTYYLHNNPTPPTGGTASQANLPMNGSVPTATTLYNYDTNRDAFAGLLLAKGGSGAGETDLTKYQNWRSSAFPSATTINGTATFEFWSAMKDFATGNTGSVQVFLRDFDPSSTTYVEIASASLTQAGWQGASSSWVQKSLSFSVSAYTIASGHVLELKLVVSSSADDDMWFAYDTTLYESKLTIP